jgi:hypothetical protein
MVGEPRPTDDSGSRLKASLKLGADMEITTRDLWTVVHGMGFGALFMLAFAGALAELYRITAPGDHRMSVTGQKLLSFYLIAMVILAWLTVFTGAYMVYPWYRAVAPAGANLADYPQKLLASSPTTSAWHSIGMEWKEHVAWLAPISMTMVAYVIMKYRRAIVQHRNMRTSVLVFTAAAFLATGVAGAFGAFLNKYAPIRGGAPIVLMQGETK